MKSKILESGFNDHYSWVKIQTKEGEFEGEAHTHPDDYEIEGKYAGCSFAERRAEIKAMKMRARFLKERYQAYQSLVNDLIYREKTDPDHYEYKVIIEYANRTYQEWFDLKEQIQLAKNKLDFDMNNRKEYVDKIQKRKNKRKHIRWVDLGEIDLSHLEKSKK